MQQSSGRPAAIGTTPAGEWGDWLAPAAAWARLLAAWQPAPVEAEDMPLLAAAGRVLSVDVSAPLDSPSFDRSAVDGYAVRADDVTSATQDAPVRLQFAGEVAMGAQSTVTVGSGEAVWVATGAMMPQDADAMVMVERTERDGDAILIRQPVPLGDNIVRRGADLHAGDVVLHAGRRLRPQDVAVLASMGLALVPVRRKPRVAIISGGDELVTPGEPLGPGQIYNSNSYGLAAQVEAWGAAPRILPRVPDRPDAVQNALASAIGEADVVLLSGGSSVGLKDLTADAIDAIAAAAASPGVVVHGVAMRPGRPTLAGVVAGKLVVGIPGNPVTAMITCEVFARPAIEALLGLERAREAGEVGDYTASGRLAARIRSQAGRQDYVRVRLVRDGDTTSVRPVPGGSGIIRSMVDADGLLVVPPERAALEEGEVVEVRLF